MNLIKAKLRVKIKSLAEESRIIRREIEKSNNQQIKSSLHHHKIDIVRTESRYTHLAYALVRGMPYSVVEKNAKQFPDLERVKKMVKRMAWDFKDSAILEWCRDANDYYLSIKE